MSVLNTASDGHFSVLIVLARALSQFGTMPRERLISICGGGAEGVERQRLNQTVTRWVELGLFNSRDAALDFGPEHAEALAGGADTAEKALPKVLRQILLKAENNSRFWEAEGNKSADLTRGLSWLLTQDVYRFDTSNRAAVEEVEERQIADNSRRLIQNDVRWNGLRGWANYLGFARDAEQFIVDPTEALRQHLSDLFGSGSEMPLPRFLAELKLVLPVMDYGEYRIAIEATLDDSEWRRPQDGRLSTSLSRAVRRLELDGAIALEARADAKEGATLTGRGDRPWRSASHIHLLATGG